MPAPISNNRASSDVGIRMEIASKYPPVQDVIMSITHGFRSHVYAGGYRSAKLARVIPSSPQLALVTYKYLAEECLQ